MFERLFDLIGKFKSWAPAAGTIAGFLGFGKIQGILVGVVATVVFLAGINLGQKMGFREGFREGQKSCKEDDRRRIWPFREDPAEELPEVLGAAVPIK